MRLVAIPLDEGAAWLTILLYGMLCHSTVPDCNLDRVKSHMSSRAGNNQLRAQDFRNVAACVRIAPCAWANCCCLLGTLAHSIAHYLCCHTTKTLTKHRSRCQTATINILHSTLDRRQDTRPDGPWILDHGPPACLAFLRSPQLNSVVCPETKKTTEP